MNKKEIIQWILDNLEETEIAKILSIANGNEEKIQGYNC
jgi:hypothetical protein